MSLNGISNGYAPSLLPSAPPSTTVRDETVRQQGARQVVSHQLAVQPPRTPAGAPRALAALPAEAPAGTDPALWSILSAEERGFFAKAQAMGPLTYGRKMAERMEPVMPAVRGGRLDIRG